MGEGSTMTGTHPGECSHLETGSWIVIQCYSLIAQDLMSFHVAFPNDLATFHYPAEDDQKLLMLLPRSEVIDNLQYAIFY